MPKCTHVDKQFLIDVRDEVEHARDKFPGSNCNVVALMEEAGELAQAAMEKPESEVWKEAVQVAAMALRVATEGDTALSTIRLARGLRK